MAFNEGDDFVFVFNLVEKRVERFDGCFGGLGVFFGFEVTVEWLRTGTVTRLPTVMLSVLFLMGAIQCGSLALIADMLKRRDKRKRMNR